MPIVLVDPTPVGGAQDGVNKVFTVANAPNPAASLQLFWNGQLQEQGVDYTLAGAVITYTSGHPAPASADAQLAGYRFYS